MEKTSSGLPHEIQRTKPDFIAFAPSSMDGSSHDTGNEHFLVFDGPDGSLMAVWTQSTFEGLPDQRIVFATSKNGGSTWSSPRTIAGANADPKTGKGMASWGFPLVSKSGRIYVLYSSHTGVNDLGTCFTGRMAGKFTDDNGNTWSDEDFIDMPRSIWDNTDAHVPANWIVWQKPQRICDGRYFTGFTRWAGKNSVERNPFPSKSWIYDFSVVEFMRFENIDDDPPVRDIVISFFASDNKALMVHPKDHPSHSCAQEPSVVALPDGRLFCVMRTPLGSPYFSVSHDGQDWSIPHELRFFDGSQPIMHPLSPCPIYPLVNGGYCLLYHNHDGKFGRWGVTDTTFHRRPVYISKGEFRPNAAQPIWFSDPRILMDNDGIAIGHGKGRIDLAMYASVTHRAGETTLWYPERKFFLLGKNLSQITLDISVPK